MRKEKSEVNENERLMVKAEKRNSVLQIAWAVVLLLMVGYGIQHNIGINNNQTDKITEQTEKITEQTDLITCLLQLHIGGDFTNREQCQQKVDEATRQITAKTPAPQILRDTPMTTNQFSRNATTTTINEPESEATGLGDTVGRVIDGTVEGVDRTLTDILGG